MRQAPKPPKPDAENARLIMQQAWQRMADTIGTYTPPYRRAWTYQQPDGETVTLWGERLGTKPFAEYHGRHGHFMAKINSRTIGKPWAINEDPAERMQQAQRYQYKPNAS